jgi:4-hydroxybenzoate polyprenyltransferase
MKKTLRIALWFTFLTVIVLPFGGAYIGIPGWALFILGIFFGSATMMWWIVYADERKRILWRQENGY